MNQLNTYQGTRWLAIVNARSYPYLTTSTKQLQDRKGRVHFHITGYKYWVKPQNMKRFDQLGHPVDKAILNQDNIIVDNEDENQLIVLTSSGIGEHLYP